MAEYCVPRRWEGLTRVVDYDKLFSQVYTHRCIAHSVDGQTNVKVKVDTTLGNRSKDVAKEAARLSGRHFNDFWSKTVDYAERPGDKDGVHTSSW